MAHTHDTRQLARTGEALTVLILPHRRRFYARINPKGWRYESLKRLCDSEVLTLTLFQQLRGVESPAAPSCATSPPSSRTCSPELSTSGLPRCIAA
jgi:hypothetical protein